MSDRPCPNCGDPVDVLYDPDESVSMDSYSKLCIIGTEADELPGYRVLHT